MNALPNEYQPLVVAKGLMQKQESIEELIVSIEDFFSSHIQKKIDSDKANASSAKPNGGSGKGIGKGKGNKNGRGNKGKAAKANANQSSQQSKPQGQSTDRECIICKTFPEDQRPPGGIKHLFADCPLLAKSRYNGTMHQSQSAAANTERPHYHIMSSSEGRGSRSRANSDNERVDRAQGASTSRQSTRQQSGRTSRHRDISDDDEYIS